MKELKTSKFFDVRFSEVDSMNVVWHGSYPLYFEDAREAFGKEYDLEYMGFFKHGYFAPLVELTFHYKKPIRYEMRPRIDIIYRPTEAAKIVLTMRFMTRRMIPFLQLGIPYRCSWIPTTILFGTIPLSILNGRNAGDRWSKLL